MVKFLFILPLLLSFIWWQYLRANGWSIEEGKTGFFYIIGGSLAVVVFLGIMYGLTQLVN